MAQKKYVSLSKLSTFLDNLNRKFASISHKHSISDISDFSEDLSATVDSELSDTSTNPVQNKVINAEFDAISEAMAVLDLALDDKADIVHDHNISDVNDLQANLDAKVPNTRTINGKALSGNISLSASDVGADASGAATSAVSSHNTNTAAHNDIRVLITTLTTRLNTLANSTDEDLDQMAEIVAYIKNNKTLIESITTSKVSVSDVVNNLTTNVTNKPLSAAQGVAIKGLIDALQSELDSHTHAISDVSGLQSALDGKAASSHGTHVTYSTTAPVMDGTASAGSATTVARSDHKHPTDTSRASKTEFDTHVANTTKHITSTERTNWNAAKSHADSAHAPSNAEANQNAFSNIAVSGQTTIAADSKTDTLTLAGSNVSITTDANNDKVTFAVADGTTSAKGVVQLTNSTSSTSTTTAATPNSVKSAYDLANQAKTAAETAQATADGKAAKSHGNHVPTTETASNARFLRNDNTWQNVTPANIGAAAASHSHNDIYNESYGTKWYHIQVNNTSDNNIFYKVADIKMTSGYNSYTAAKIIGYLYDHNGNWEQSETYKIPFQAVINITNDSAILYSTVICDSDHIRIVKTATRTYELQARCNANHCDYDIYYQIISSSNNIITPYTSYQAASTTGTVIGITQMQSYGNKAYSATTASNVAWTGVTGKPSYYDAKAIKGITRSGTTFTYTCMDGTTGTFTQQDNNTTYSAATQSAQGLMSAADKTKLDGIATGANKITVDTAMSTTSTNPVQNKVVQAAINALRNEFANGSW